MAGIGHGEWLRAIRHKIAAENRSPLSTRQRRRIKPQRFGKRRVEKHEPRRRHGNGRLPDIKTRRQAGIAIVEGKARAHPKRGMGLAMGMAIFVLPSAFQPRSYCGGVGTASVRPSSAAACKGQ